MPTINENPNPSILPKRPFDGQRFIDRNGVEWIYSSSHHCWISNGRKPNIPSADEETTGLLSKDLKRTLNNIANKGGGFGIVVKPLLAVKPYNVTPKFSDKVLRSAKTKSGSTIWGVKPYTKDKDDKYNPYVENKMAGLILEFKTGKLKKKQFTVLSNDEGRIFIDGDLSSARSGDEFSLFDPVELNPFGILSGDVEFVSDSLDIKCVTGDLKDDICVPTAQDGLPPDGLNITLKEKLLKALCFEIPGCKGKQGEDGNVGAAGQPGTGDGPKGDTGEPGEDATGNAKFTGIKFEEVDDVFDTAVVAIEPDPDSGKLYIVKAKVRTPLDSMPADQVIASAISRSISFDEEFFYSINKPSLDPIEADSQVGIAMGKGCFLKSDYKNDVIIAAYPKGGAGVDGDSQVAIMWLSDLLNQMTEYYRKKLTEAAETYDAEVKEFITKKDDEARSVICNLAQQLAECEWEEPLEFCLGLVSNDCAENTEETTTFPLASLIFGDEKFDVDSNPQAQVVSRPIILGGEGSHFPERPVVVRIDGKNASGREVDTKGNIVSPDVVTEFTAGDYIIVWDGGSMQDYDFLQLGHFVGRTDSTLDYGVFVRIVHPDGTEEIKPFPVPNVLKSPKIKPNTAANVPMGAWCISNPNGPAQYSCDLIPRATGNPAVSYEWIEGAFQGNWNPGEVFQNGQQVPKPGSSPIQTGPSGGISSKFTPFDKLEVEEAYTKADYLSKSVTWSFAGSGGKVSLICPLVGSGIPPQFANREQSIDDCLSNNNIIKFKIYKVVNSVTNVNIS